MSTSRNRFQASGRVVDDKSRAGIPGLRVEAWDKDWVIDDLVGSAVTGTDGSFVIRFDESYFSELFWDKRPDIYFKVYLGTTLVTSTITAVLWNVSNHPLPVEILVNLPKASIPDGRSVSGRISRADGLPLPGISVRALDKDVLEERLLGQTVTNDGGHYEIPYTLENLSTRIDLVVRVMDADEKEVAASPVVYSAGEREVIDLTAEVGSPLPPSEYEQIRERLTPLLQGLDPSQLTEDQIAYIKGASGLQPRLVGRYFIAAQMAGTTGQSADLFYGLLRAELPLTLDGILAQHPDSLRDALLQGQSGNLIPIATEEARNAFLSALRALVIRKAFQDSSIRDRAAIGKLITATASITQSKAEQLLLLYGNHQGSVQAFWQGLRNNPDFKDSVDDVQFSLQAGLVGGNFLPMVTALQERRKAGEIHDWKDLARWSPIQWKSVVTSAPADTPGDTAQAKVDQYVATLVTALEKAFPTQAIAARLAESDAPNKHHLVAFFQDNPAFYLEHDPLDHYLAGASKALDGVPEKERSTVKKELRTLQRLSRITPSYAEVQLLVKGNISSARAAARLGKDAFVERFRDDLGEARASHIFREADWRHATALNLMGKYHPEINLSFPVIGKAIPPGPKEGLPDWETLFGSQDYCACDQCRSVLSPAAYFTDILHFLKDRKAITANKSVKDILFERRPDLGEIELTCENTNLPLPYVDLANELLEEAISPSTAVPTQDRQTRATTSELAANPEHPNPESYDTLRNALFPWTLPFDLWIEETRVYLRHLGVDRLDLIRAYAPKNSRIAAEVAAGEALGLSQAERKIVTGTHPDSPNPWKFWGISSSTGWVDQVKGIRHLLDKSGLRYEDLQALLQTAFINPNGSACVASIDASDPLTSDTNKLALSGLPNSDLGPLLDRMHRFVRLQRRLGWSVSELDAAITAFQCTDLTIDSLRALAAVQQCMTRFGLETEEVLAWFARVDTRSAGNGTKCLYERLYQNPSVIKRPSGETDPFALRGDRKELNTIGTLADVSMRPTLSAALGLSEADLALLIDSPSAIVSAGKSADLENLSRLFRVASFARAMGLSIGEFMRARAILPENPFVHDQQPVSATQVEATLAFADRVENVRSLGTTFGDLDYLLRHQGTSPASPTEETLSTLLAELRLSLRDNREATDDIRTEAIVQKMSNALGVNASVARYLLSDWPEQPANPAHRLKVDFLDSNFWNLDDAINSTRYPEIFRSLRRLFKAVALGSGLRLTPQELIWTAKNASALGWLAFQSLPGDATEAAASFEGWEKFSNFFRWAKGLPSASSNGFIEVLEITLSYTGSADTAKKRTVESVAGATGWALTDLESLLGIRDQTANTGSLGFGFPLDFRDTNLWIQLAKLFSLYKRLGASADQASGWASAAPSQADARAAKQEAKSKHDDATWLSVAKPLRNSLREKQRSALVDYLVVRPDPSKGWTWQNQEDLYAHFLIDIQMSPCQMTSRLKQAAASVQLFVQRCLMNLEPKVKADASKDSHWLQWKWMKTYRVWEANRKIFLWPENWIEPELRDDKSPFFKEMEEELLQNDITLDTAETAFQNYLDKLDQVSRLEIRGVYQDNEDGRDLLHVFGRTSGGQPYTWYYRRREYGWRWTAWEKMALDIEGGQLLPVLWDRRLHVYWPIITEESNPDADLTMPAAGGTVVKPSKIWKVQLGWSELIQGRWSGKHITAATLPIPGTLGSTLGKTGFGLTRSGHLIEMWVGQGTRSEYVGAFAFSEGMVEPQVKPISATPFVGNRDSPASAYPSPQLAGAVGTRYRDGRFVQPDSLYSSLYSVSLCRNGTFPYKPVLHNVKGKFSVSYPAHYASFDYMRPFFYQDDGGTFLVTPEPELSLVAVLAWDLIPIEMVLSPVAASSARLVTPSTFVPGDQTEGATTSAAALLSNTSMSGTVGTSSTVVYMMTRDPKDSSGGHDGDDTAAPLGGGANTPPPKPQPSPSPLPPTPPTIPFSATVERKLYFQEFEHPYSRDFTRRLRAQGLDGLLTRDVQLQSSPDDFINTYHPEQIHPVAVATPYPKKEVDFSPGGAYSLYNWEVFFHAPLLIAQSLSNNQKFEEAQRWFHYIFDPMDTTREDAPQKYWRTRKFFETTTSEYALQEIRRLLQDLASGVSHPDLQQQIQEWRANPFKPHAIARIRTVAYQKTVVMKYIDNLLDLGDSLFRRNTIESINEATQVYVLAAEILGRKPEFIQTRAASSAQTFNTLEGRLRTDDFSDPSVALESYVSGNGPDINDGTTTATPVPPELLFFCVPRNEKLLAYWDLVADRLFKIRHCMDITGRAQQLPLFDPPIDPGMLVKASAAGLDLSDVLSDSSAPLPPYRFQTLSQKASELCGEVKALGSALLSVLERKDSEGLALLRSAQELKVLAAARKVHEQQINEAEATLDGLIRSQELITLRRNYYQNMLFLSPFETVGLGLSTAALGLQATQVATSILAGGLHLLPNAKIGAPPSIGGTYGGDNVGNAAKSFAASLGEIASLLNAGASLSNTMGNYERRWDEWKFQENLAHKELEQVDRQIAAAHIRIAIAKRELDNHDLQVENAQASDEYMRERFTNLELYNWMSGQIASVYFQTYKLASDVAKRAERTYCFELGLETSDFIQPTHWDSLKKGLLAGEKLHHDLRRMEMDYLDKNVRDYEITKTVSLAMINPAALIALKQTGDCFFSLSEAMFDMDYPGHFFRRIKSVALSMPCVVDPYEGVHATLTLTGSSLRKNALLKNNKYEKDPDGDDRFRADLVPVKNDIVTSTGHEDSGLFEANLRDERYLPFEGAGAADSQWRLVLDKDSNRFSLDSLSDVILHVRYTAKDGKDALRSAAKASLKVLEMANTTTPMHRLVSLKGEFADDWQQFLHPGETDPTQSLLLDFTSRLPVGTRLSSVEMFLKVKPEALPPTPDAVPVHLFAGHTATGNDLLLNAPLSYVPLGNTLTERQMHHTTVTFATAQPPGAYYISMTGTELPDFIKRTTTVGATIYPHLDFDKVDDLFLLLRLVYT